MKQIIYLTFSLLILSCTSSKIEKKVLNDFISEKFRKPQGISILVKQPINRTLPLCFYEKAYQDRNIRLGEKIRIRPNSNAPFEWPIDTLEIKKLKTIYKNETSGQLWKKKDFKRSKFELADAKNISEKGSVIFEKHFGNKLLEISKPIITTNNKYAFLFFRTSYVGIYFGHTIQGAVLLKSVNGDWKTIETYSEFDIIN
jgi:hypothetical protein